TTEGELDPKNFARLQSLLSVEKVSGLGGLSGSVLALQSGVSPRDGTCGRLLVSEYQSDGSKVLAALSDKAGGPFTCGGPADVHQLGVHEGTPINSMHLSIGALFKGGQGDGPLGFELGTMPELEPQPNVAPVHLGWTGRAAHPWVGGGRPGVWAGHAEAPPRTAGEGESGDPITQPGGGGG